MRGNVLVMRRWKVRLLCLLLTCMALIAVVSTASAQAPADADRAADLKKRGDAAMDAARTAEALALYTEAYTLSKDPALLYNQGRAFEALDDFPSALDRLEEFKKAASPELLAKVPGIDARIISLKGRIANVTIVVNVAGANISVRDRLVGQSPLPAALRLEPGKISVEASAGGYMSRKREVEVRGGESVTVSIELLSKQTSGTLAVDASVSGAAVMVDGKMIGTAPAEVGLLAGTHDITVTRDGYENAHTSAVVDAGGTKRVRVTLEEKAGLLTKWWFWTGVGVVVASGIVTAIALTTERSPDSGTLSPGRVSGPLVRF